MQTNTESLPQQPPTKTRNARASKRELDEEIELTAKQLEEARAPAARRAR